MRAPRPGPTFDRRAGVPVALALFALALSAARAAGSAPPPGPALGLLLDPDRAASLPAVSADLVRRPLVRIELRFGGGDGSDAERAIAAVRAAGFRVALALAGSRPLDPAAIEPWVAFVRGAVSRFGGKAEVFEIDIDPGGDDAAADAAALLVKQSALAVRATASGAGVEAWVAVRVGPSSGLEALRRLWQRDVAAYVDILALDLDPRAGPEAAIAAVGEARREALAHPPAAAIWAYAAAAPEWTAAEAALAALGAGAAVAAFEPGPGQASWAAGLQDLLGTGYEPAPTGGIRVAGASGEPVSGARVLARFFLERDFTTLAVVRAPAVPGAGALRLVIDAAAVRNARWIDPVTGAARRVGTEPSAGGSTVVMRAEASEIPQVVLFQKQVAGAGLDLPVEEVAIEATRGLTAEEIISRYQEVQREQDDRLERFIARGRIDFHFQLAQGGAGVDVSIASNYFWVRGGELEWEQTDYYFNGNRVRWKNIPELPLIQPEKVITLPLDLTLNRTYRYRLTGEDQVEGRPAWVLEFQPADPAAALDLYRGKVWIDRERFVRLKASLIQSGLAPPVLSNEEIDRYTERTGPDGRPYWLLDGIDGQQVWNAAGRTFVVRREVTFLEYRINPPAEEFGARRAEAYASNHQMLRDTDRGFRYLERQDDGTRSVRQKMDTSQLFAAAGAFKDDSQDHVLPLAGVNYFNYDLGGHNVQLNALFAGVFAFVTASKPDLFGSRIDLTADASLSAIAGDDKVFSGDRELEAERIRARNQSVSLRVGLPAGAFFKVNLIARLTAHDYSEAPDADGALRRLEDDLGTKLEFVLPQDHYELSGEVETVWNRRGYSLAASGRFSHRSDWRPWGLREKSTREFGTFGDEGFTAGPPDALEEYFAHYAVGVAKEWYLPHFQKIRAAVDYLDGSGLDRFGRYQFSFFGDDRLNGFSGSGVRFDRGMIARAGYSFNLFEAIRFDAALDAARVEEEGSAAGRQSFAGVGLTANVVGPWKTVINLNYGYALDSDIPDLEGQQEFLLLVFKLF